MKTLELIKKLQAEKNKAKDRFYSNSDNKKVYSNKDNKPEEFKDKTFLYIRALETDNGSRPLPAGTVFWNSPDIELFNDAGTVIPTNELALNKNHTITVLVHNEGDMTCNSCIVELFICNPVIGFDRAHATQIGIQNLSILGHSTATATFSFVPGNANLGHQCLFARAYSYTSADMPESAEQFLTTTDRHIGQQNLSIVNQGTTFDFMVIVPDKFRKQNFTLKVKQKKTLIKNPKLNVLKKLIPLTRTMEATRFNLLKNTGTENKFTLVKDKLDKPQFRRFAPIQPTTSNTWIREFVKGPNKVTLDIPNMLLGKNEATQLDIEMINEKTGISLGGLTIIVKG